MYDVMYDLMYDVIMYDVMSDCPDAVTSPIRMVQRLGRTGRKRAGNYFFHLEPSLPRITNWLLAS